MMDHLTMEWFLGLPGRRRRRVAEAVGEGLMGALIPLPYSPETELLPAFREPRTDLEMLLVPGGTYRRGLSPAEERAARRLCDPIPANLEEMRPSETVEVSPFFLGRCPVTEAAASAILEQTPDDASPLAPAWRSREETLAVVSALGCRLPEEIEWEYACRGGSSTLFTWGDHLPSDQVLETWLVWDASDGTETRRNGFGLEGLFGGEWCADPFSVSYRPGAAIEEDSFVVRGSGTQFWPWQDEEWVWCASAMRMPSSGLFDGRCGFRLARDLPSDLKASLSDLIRKW